MRWPLHLFRCCTSRCSSWLPQRSQLRQQRGRRAPCCRSRASGRCTAATRAARRAAAPPYWWRRTSAGSCCTASWWQVPATASTCQFSCCMWRHAEATQSPRHSSVNMCHSGAAAGERSSLPADAQAAATCRSVLSAALDTWHAACSSGAVAMRRIVIARLGAMPPAEQQACWPCAVAPCTSALALWEADNLAANASTQAHHVHACKPWQAWRTALHSFQLPSLPTSGSVQLEDVAVVAVHADPPVRCAQTRPPLWRKAAHAGNSIFVHLHRCTALPLLSRASAARSRSSLSSQHTLVPCVGVTGCCSRGTTCGPAPMPTTTRHQHPAAWRQRRWCGRRRGPPPRRCCRAKSTPCACCTWRCTHRALLRRQPSGQPTQQHWRLALPSPAPAVNHLQRQQCVCR
jgi:hypothetical protein